MYSLPRRFDEPGHPTTCSLDARARWQALGHEVHPAGVGHEPLVVAMSRIRILWALLRPDGRDAAEAENGTLIPEPVRSRSAVRGVLLLVVI